MVLHLPPTNTSLFIFPRKSIICPTLLLNYSPFCFTPAPMSASWVLSLTLALSHCTHQVKIAYQNLCLDKTHFINLRYYLFLLLPSLQIYCMSCYYLCLYCLVLISRHAVRPEIRLQEPDAPPEQLGLLTGYPVRPRDCTAKVPKNLKRS